MAKSESYVILPVDEAGNPLPITKGTEIATFPTQPEAVAAADAWATRNEQNCGVYRRIGRSERKVIVGFESEI